jgi:hypothetical protein
MGVLRWTSLSCTGRYVRKLYLLLWLINYSFIYVPLKNIPFIWTRHHYRWRATKFRPMFGAKGLWAGRDLYRATPAVTRGLGLSGPIRKTATFSRLLRHTRGCGVSILTRILTGPHLVAFYDTLEDVENLFYPGSSRVIYCCVISIVLSDCYSLC